MKYQSKKVFFIGVAVFLSMACVGVHGYEVAASSASCHDGVVRGGEKEKLSEQLFQALEYDNIADVLTFIKKGANVTVQNSFGEMALHVATLKGFVRFFDLLIQRGANVDAQDSRGETALHLAAMIGHVSIIKKLIAHNADVNIKNKDGKTPRDLACEHHPYDDSIAHEFPVPLDSSSLSEDALFSRDSAEMHDFEASDSIDARLCAAVNHGSSAQLLALLEDPSVDINAKYSKGNTLLHFAAERGDLDAFRVIISKKPNISLKNDAEEMPVDIAKKGEFYAITHELILRQDSINKELLVALKNKNIKKALASIKLGAGVNAQSSRGGTALHLAVIEADVHAIITLIKHKADVNIKNKDGKTPMDLARELHPGNKSITDALVPPLDSSSLPFASAAEVSGELDGEPVQQKQQKRARVS